MRLILLGQGPLPLAENTHTNATGYRTWHFACALGDANHQIALVLIDSAPQEPRRLKPNLTIYTVSAETVTQGNFLAQLCVDFQPEAAVTASIFPAYLAALYLPPELPLWADFFGSPLAEGQAKAFVHHDDALVEPYARFERVVARRADAFSVVSTYQKYALVGVLATHGRFNQYSYGHDFVSVVPAAVDPEILPHTASVLRGRTVPGNAFVVLWSGGYNTWTDVDTLFKALEAAMSECANNLHFVSTGGAIAAHDEATYAHFSKLVANSSHRDSFHLLGWLPLSSLHNYYYEADVGIILDKWSYEGVLGSRTRLLDWLKYGLPAITTVTAELTEILVKQNLAFGFPHGDATALADLLIKLVRQPGFLQERGKQASAWVLENYSYSKVCQPLVAWAENPQCAPDADRVLNFSGEAGENLEMERKLANLTNQLEQKNAHISQLEEWAHAMEARLKNGDIEKASSLARLTNLVKKRK